MWGAVSLWLICILNLMIKEVEHLFMYLSFLEKHLFRSSAHLKIRLFVFVVVVWVIYIFLDINPLSYILFANIFSHFSHQVAFSFCWLFPLLCRTFLVWCSSTCLFLLLLLLHLKSDSKSHHQALCLRAYYDVFFRSFMVSGPMFKSLFEFKCTLLLWFSFFFLFFNPVSCFHRITTLHTWFIKILILVF